MSLNNPTVGAAASPRSEFVRGLALAALPVILTLCANIPGRRVFALRESSFGRPAWQFFVGGLFGDLVTDLPVLGAAMLLGALLGVFAVRRSWPLLARVGVGSTALLLIVLAVVLWMFSVGGTEHKLQRGLYPTYLETKMALSDSTFVWGSLPLLVIGRYRWLSLVGAIVALAAVAGFTRKEWRRPGFTWARVAGLAAGVVGIIVLSAPALFAAPLAFPAVDHRRELYPPLVTLAKGLMSQPKTQIFRGLRAVFSNAKFPDDQKTEGARALGLSEAHARATIAAEATAECAGHPWRRPLDRDRSASKASAAPLLSAAEALSKSLFEQPAGPIVIWHVAVESFRADDIAGLNPAAPREIAPYLTSIIEDSRQGRGTNVAFARNHQSGVRTSQNVSAMMCGIGALPFNMALSRDVGYLPIRCVTDVLGDAGFATHVYYASELSFDNMIEFFRYHGVKTTQQMDLPRNLPKAVWGGLSDLPLYEEALRRSAAAGGAQYNFVLTLAGHTPFDEPEDLPVEVRTRVNDAIARSGASPSEDDRKRLWTIAYGDWSLEQFFKRIDESPAASRSMVVVLGDHSTGDPFLWKSGATAEARSRVPMLLHLPEALLASAKDAAAARASVAELQKHGAEIAFSSADVPTLLLSLLSATTELRALDPAWRWHTLGGVATSDDYSLAPHPGAKIWGVDAASDIFVVEEGAAHGVGERNESFTEPEQVTQLGPVVRGVGAIFSSFLAGYASRCPGAENIRKAAPPAL